MGAFEGKTVLIAGSATGLGEAVAEAVAEAGGRLVLLDFNEDLGRATAQRLGGRFWRVDVADPEGWRHVVEEIWRSGPVNYAHLNAGIMTWGSSGKVADAQMENVSPERYRRVLGVNVDGVFFGLQALLPRMNSSDGEAITVTSSAAGLIPIPFDPVYALSKHAVVGLVRSLALAYSDGRTRLNVICPGGFASPLLPAEFHSPGTMKAADMAREVTDLLLNGRMGETRLKLRTDTPAEAVRPPRDSLA